MAQEEEEKQKAAESQQSQEPVGPQPPPLPSPDGEPEPVAEGLGDDYKKPLLDTAAIVVLVGVGVTLFAVVGGMTTATAGATRSAKLQVEQRRQLIQQAEAEERADCGMRNAECGMQKK